MKLFALMTFSAAFIMACNSPKNDNTEPQPIGFAEDNHGCNGAAGQTWSELKQDCIQVFNEGVRLNPTEQSENNAIISAFVIINPEETKAELFLPEREKTIILTKAEEGIYQTENYLYNHNEGVLYVDGEKKFERE